MQYLGIDETPLYLRNYKVIVVAETSNPELTIDYGHNAFPKAKDFLKKGMTFPTLDDLIKCGLDNYYWTLARPSKFSMSEMQHANIAHIVTSNGYKAENVEIYIDQFFNYEQKSNYILREYMKARGFPVSHKQIHIYDGGDRSIPVINMADLLACQIAIQHSRKYEEFNKISQPIPTLMHFIPYEEHRITVAVNQKRKIVLGKAIANWRLGMSKKLELERI